MYSPSKLSLYVREKMAPQSQTMGSHETVVHSSLSTLAGNEDYYTKVNCEQLGCGYDFYRDNNLDFIDNGTYSTFRFTERAQEIIGGHDPSQPLFLYVPYQAVHFPLEVWQCFGETYLVITMILILLVIISTVHPTDPKSLCDAHR